MRITVPFEGDGSGTGELTWGQFAAWRSMQVVEATEWAGGTMPLAAGTTVRDVVTTLGFIMSRHQSLRTRLQPTGDGPPLQVLAASGAITLEVHDDDGDPERLATTIREQYEADPWDPFTDWPVRMEVVADGDRAIWFVALYCHMVIDGYGFEALIADLADLDPAGLAVIDTGGCTFDEAVARTFRSQLTAGMHAYYHPRDLWALVDRVGAERGVELDTGCYFNDRRRSAAQAPDPTVPAPERISAALAGGELRWGPSSDEWDATCFLHVDAAADAVELTWRVDTASVSPQMLEACLRGIESLVVTAALEQAATPAA